MTTTLYDDKVNWGVGTGRYAALQADIARNRALADEMAASRDLEAGSNTGAKGNIAVPMDEKDSKDWDRGDDPSALDQYGSSKQPRKPIFSAEDKANPLKCCTKVTTHGVM
jgi:hypothetical protein